VNGESLTFSRDWDISPTGIHTDHQLVSVKLSKKKMPFVAEGRWSLLLYVLNDKRLSDDIINLGRTLHQEINESMNQRTETNNPQLTFSTFKKKAIALCRNTATKVSLRRQIS
jgi:hypothetical protein